MLFARKSAKLMLQYDWIIHNNKAGLACIDYNGIETCNSVEVATLQRQWPLVLAKRHLMVVQGNRGCSLFINEEDLKCRHCSMACGSKSAKNLGQSSAAGEESSESDGETEPAKSFHRRLSTNREINCSVCLCEILFKKLVLVCK